MLRKKSTMLYKRTFSRFCRLSQKDRQSCCRFNNMCLKDCRGHGYDTGSNMRGKYEEAQNHTQRKHKYAVNLLFLVFIYISIFSKR